jgi:hypothetical protein
MYSSFFGGVAFFLADVLRLLNAREGMPFHFTDEYRKSIFQQAASRYDGNRVRCTFLRASISQQAVTIFCLLQQACLDRGQRTEGSSALLGRIIWNGAIPFYNYIHGLGNPIPTPKSGEGREPGITALILGSHSA